MKDAAVMMIIISGLCFLPTCLPHIYHLVQIGMSWAQAQVYCKKHYTDLAAVHNVQDVAKLKAVLVGIQKIWIGLRADTDSWRWSLENPEYYSEGEAEFRMWTVAEPNSTRYYEACAAMLGNGNWSVQVCNSQYSFFCYNKVKPNPQSCSCDQMFSDSSRFIFVNVSKTWGNAQSYCRNYHTDLASVRNQSENEQLKMMMVGSFAWIGLYRNSWKWSDGSANSFTSWAPSNPSSTITASCGAVVKSQWLNDDCKTPWYFVCYTALKKKMVLKIELKKNDTSVDMEELNEDILEKFSQRLIERGLSGDVKLRWVRQPDGSVYKKEEEQVEEKVESCGK